MKILITGANGMVARAAIKYCESIGDEVSAFTRQELDIANSEDVRDIFSRERPEAVLNCAAFTNVDASETDVERCYAANAVGVENLASAAKRIDSVFVTISTDYVFDGAKDGFYTQLDEPNPLGVYGKAKLDGEIRAANAYAQSIIVRSGWIFGDFGTNFQSVMPQLLGAGKPIKAIADAYGTPTFALDLAKRLRELAVLNVPGIYHVTNSGDKASFAGFARKMCQIKGLDESLVENVSMDSLKRPAPRPRSSPLACLASGKLGLSALQSWERALEEFLRDK